MNGPQTLFPTPAVLLGVEKWVEESGVKLSLKRREGRG